MRLRVIGTWLEVFALCIQLSRLTAGDRDWQTDCEKSNQLRTPHYAETINFLQKLAAVATEMKMVPFGQSGAGRNLWVAILSKQRYFDPSHALASGLPVVMINNCIHPGESEGKDACLAFARDLLIHRKYPEILDHCILLIIPIFNADGHERFGAYNRMNQNGPVEMGWRVTATNLNLNRDFLKAETPEMRAWLTLFNQWLPHLFIDCHTTDGADFQYDLLYNIDTHPEFGGAVSVWARDIFLPRMLLKCEQMGHVLGPYAGLIDPLHPEKGLRGGVWTPRLSNPYVTLRNRAGLLIETHSLKDYRTRVKASYDFILASLETLLENPGALTAAIAQEDNCCEQFGHATTTLPLVYKIPDQGDSILYRGYEIEARPGIISGRDYLTYRPIPRDIPSIYFNQVSPTLSVPVPLGYLIPKQWKEIITVLRYHGLKLFRLSTPVSGTFDAYQFKNPRWATQSYEGRLQLEFETDCVTKERSLPAGTVYVPIAQPGAKVLMYLLEPQSADALIHWGFFNAIFEQKEYFEDYIMEPLAQKMLQENSQLKTEFETRLATDSNFAASPYRRLQFFYLRSPYKDPEQNVYPIVRVTRPISFNLEPF